MYQRTERVPSTVPNLSAAGMSSKELLRRVEEGNQEKNRSLIITTIGRKRLGLANKLGLTALSLAALFFSAGNSSARHLPSNNQTVEDSDKSNSDEIEVANAAILETPFILNGVQATMTPVVEPTLEPTLQPTETPGLIVTKPVEGNVNSELSINVEMVNCPSGWPLEHGVVTQGPKGATSHAALYPSEQAIDIGVPSGDLVSATFDGQVVTVNFDTTNNYGIFVDVKGECNGIPFTARWAHLSAVSDGVMPGAVVDSRQTIGAVGQTGKSIGGSHLHYSFFNLEMAAPNVPVAVVSFKCDSESQCGVQW